MADETRDGQTEQLAVYVCLLDALQMGQWRSIVVDETRDGQAK